MLDTEFLADAIQLRFELAGERRQDLRRGGLPDRRLLAPLPLERIKKIGIAGRVLLRQPREQSCIFDVLHRLGDVDSLPLVDLDTQGLDQVRQVF